MIKTIALSVLCIVLIRCAESAPVGQTLDSKQLSELITGATIKGISTRTGHPFRLKFGADGTYAGESGGGILEGGWQITKDGKFCDSSGCKKVQRISRDTYNLFYDNGRIQEVTIEK